MNDPIPFFPLSTIIFPGNYLNLHVFEPRYKQLVKDCVESEKPFGIPTFLDGKVREYGTLVSIDTIEKTYSDGKMDIKTNVESVIKIQSFLNPMKQKLYAGGHVEVIDDEDDSSFSDRLLLCDKVRRLYEILDFETDIDPEEEFLSYYIGNNIGLKLGQEFQMLTIRSERDRISFLTEHLSRSIPIIEEMEKVKTRIRLNGHFRHFDPLNF